jgi:hypothetical protein
MGLLLLIGWRLRGPPLGIVLAYAWAAYPFTLYAMNCNVNDALVGALVLAAIAAAAKPGRRGLFVALAGMAKFAPLGLAPLMATHTRGVRRYTLGLVAGLAACAALIAAYGGPHAFFDRTLGFQAQRDSPFSIWGLYGWNVAQGVVQVLTVALAVAVAFLPRRRDVVGLSALSAAVLVAVQLGIDHWFYLYIVWFFGPAMIALLGDEEPAIVEPRAWSVDELARLPAPAVAWR